MPVHWQPVGPLPPGVYWRRRLAVLLAAVLAVAALVWLLGRGAGPDRLQPAAEPSGSPDAAPSSGGPSGEGPSATATPAPQPCEDAALEVQATAASADVPLGTSNALRLTVRNTGSAPCTRALGQGAVEIVVTSGTDRIWSSDDCAPGGDAGQTVLQPGEAFEARATWPGSRSSAGCPPDQPAAQPGTYRVNARVGELRVSGMVFRVTG